MSSSPFGCNANRSLSGYGKAKALAPAPPEPVTLVADRTQVITAQIPFNTKQAGKIRQAMHENILVNGQRVFIYRQVNGWTTVALDSTEQNPKLTADPYTTLKIAWKAFNDCPFVDPLIIKDANNNNVTYEGIDSLVFDDLPAGEDAPAVADGRNDAEVIMDEVNAIKVSVKEQLEAQETKMAYMVSLIEGLVEKKDETPKQTKKKAPVALNNHEASSSNGTAEVEPVEPTTTAARKRKAKTNM